MVGTLSAHRELRNDATTQKPRDHKRPHHESGDNRPHDIVDKGGAMLANFHAHVNIERCEDKCRTGGVKNHGIEQRSASQGRIDHKYNEHDRTEDTDDCRVFDSVLVACRFFIFHLEILLCLAES